MITREEFTQELKLMRIFLLLNVLNALVFMFLVNLFAQSEKIFTLYGVLITSVIYSIILLVIAKPENYRPISIIFISFLVLTNTLAIICHKPEHIFSSTAIVFTFIIICNALLVGWPQVIMTNIVLIFWILFFMIWPGSGFITSVKLLNLDPKFIILASMIFFSALLVWATSMVQVKRRTERKLRYMNDNLNQLVEEKVNELRIVDQKQREYQEQVESIFQHIPVGVLILDQNLNYLYTNGTHFKFLIKEEKIEELPNNILPLSYLKEQVLQPHLTQVAQQKVDLIGQKLEYTAGDETQIIIRYSFVAVKLAGEFDELLRLVLITEDITQEDIMRERLIHSDHLTELGKMAANLAHEVNNPLAGIKLYLELLEQGISDKEKLKKVYGILDNSINRIDHVIKGFLSFARQDKARKDWVDISKAIEETLDIAVGFKSIHHINIIPNLPKGLPKIMADRFKLGQVFLNLINNAKDAMAESGGILSIDVHEEAGRMLIEFKDNGKGIKQEEIQHVFTPFYTTKARGHGTGLGLATCYGIIHEHGGSIEVFSREGLGTTFAIKLPIKGKVELTNEV